MRFRRRATADIRTMAALFAAAEEEAARAGEPMPAAVHLLLAALGLPEGSARRAFERAGADPDRFRRAVDDQHADALRSVGLEPSDEAIDAHLPPPGRPRGPLRTTASAQELFQQVAAVARAERSEIRGAHVVLVAAGAEGGTTVRALRHMGIDLVQMQAAARAELDQPGTTT